MFALSARVSLVALAAAWLFGHAGVPLAHAQNIGRTTATLTGTVKDVTGGVLPGTAVAISGPALPGGQDTVTGADGTFTVVGLFAGTYRVEARLDGFTPAAVENINLKVGETLRVDLTMSAGFSNTITVQAAPLVDVVSSERTVNLTTELLEELPKNRSWESIAQVAPGVNAEGTNAQTGTPLISFQGASVAENVYIVDGVDTTSSVTATTGQNVVFEFIGEMQLKSGFIGADYGGALGGVVNLTTKSGSNTMAGGVTYQYTGSRLTERPRRRLRINPTAFPPAADYVQDPQDPENSSDVGFTIGGPIVRDRVWYFGGYVPQLTYTTRQTALFGRSTPGGFERSDLRHYANAKVTWRAATPLTVNVTGSNSPQRIVGQLPSYDGTSGPDADYNSIGTVANKRSYAASFDWVARHNVFVNGFAGRYERRAYDLGKENLDIFTFATTNATVPGIPANLVRPAGYSSVTGVTTNLEKDNETRNNAGATVTATFSAAGQHTIKAGLQYSKTTSDIWFRYSGDRVDLRWGQSALGQTGTYGVWRLFDIETNGAVTGDNTALFIQDSWTVADRWTLNLGLRTEREEVRPLAKTPVVIKFGWADKIAPRLGLVWDVRGNSTWKMYTNFGVFYDTLKHSAPRDVFDGRRFEIRTYTLDDLDWPSLGFSNVRGRLIQTLNFVGTSPSVDPDVLPTRTNEFSVGTQVQLSPTLALNAQYMRRDLANAIDDFNLVNPATYPAPGSTIRTIIGNPGRGQITALAGAAFPHARPFTRTYDGLELELRRTFANNWTATANYTLSQLRGNYSGLADADESLGGANPNAGRYGQYVESFYGAGGKADEGPLALDRPHQFKLSGSYRLPLGVTVGGFFRALSGTPLSPVLGLNAAGIVYPEGRGGRGRTDAITQTDLFLQYGLDLGKARASIFVNLLNAFDQKAAIGRSTRVLNGDSVTINIPLATYFAGVDYNTFIPATLRDPRFDLANRFQAPRSIRVGMRVDF